MDTWIVLDRLARLISFVKVVRDFWIGDLLCFRTFCEEALLEVGGDPAFLDSFDEHADSDAYALELQRAEIEDVGGDPSFL